MKQFSLLMLLIALVACSKPIDTIVPTSIDKIESIKPQIDKLTQAERDLFSKYVVRHARGSAFGAKADPIPEGITIGQAIDEQRLLLKKEAELLNALRAERDKWQFESTTDKFTDEKTAFASIEEDTDGGGASYTSRASLVELNSKLAQENTSVIRKSLRTLNIEWTAIIT